MRGGRTVCALALAATVTGTSSRADPALLDFMGGQGCTLGPESRAAALAAGFGETAIAALIEAALQDGSATEQGDYVVLGASICTIRLPEIESPFSVTSPEIRAITGAVDEHAAEGQPGCFLSDPSGAFAAMTPDDPDTALEAYLDFIATGLVSGELRFYGPDPLSSPFGFQVVTGDCAELANIDAIRRSHQALLKGFGDYVRLLGEGNACEGAGEAWSRAHIDLTYRLQGAQPEGDPADQPEVNAWLFFEFDLIALAAGWHAGMTATDRGTPRPPLCHYPDAG